MSWILLIGLAAALGLAFLVTVARRTELSHMERKVRERELAVRHGTAEARLQHPVIDLSRCLGCGSCVSACPEEGVLDLVHGQAVVVKGSRCMGISACERECPVGAIVVTLGGLEELAGRRDVPAVEGNLEAVGSPGLFLAGEVTANALIKTAIDHGTTVGAEVARRASASVNGNGEMLDLCIVGAGPAGLACSLEAKRNRLRFVTIDQEHELGGTVARYPREKLVLTQPVEMPLYGRLRRTSYQKEELIDLWRGIAEEQELPIRGGETFEGLERNADGDYLVRTATSVYAAHNVCLALGRRGTPERLGVPGEELPKVAYSMLDARSHQGRRILVVGGGDSAVEAAVALAEQPGNEVALSYRREAFFRLGSRIEKVLEKSLEEGRLRVIFQSRVAAIREDTVELTVGEGEALTLPNDEVFVMVGGTPPIDLLERSGVSFDPQDRPGAEPVAERGPGLMKALGIGFFLALAAVVWALWHGDYYLLSAGDRPTQAKHALLRPGMGAGLVLGIASTVMIAVNLLYLLRRSPRYRFSIGSLQLWMTSHVATGILALLCATLHGAMAPRSTPGGHAFWALSVLLVTGAIGRYFYAWVPRAANGRELELSELKARLRQVSERRDVDHQGFREWAQEEVLALIDRRQWKGSLAGRILALLGVQVDLRRILGRLAKEGARQGVPPETVSETIGLARRAHQTALMTAHYEDLRAVASSWRYLHRWIAILMVVLVVLHVAFALSYGAFFEGGAS